MRISRLRNLVTARPTLLLRDGAPIEAALREQRVTMDEVRQAVRSSGAGDVSSIGAVVLESDGSLSVIPAGKLGNGSSLGGVRGFDD
ncbi:YetF domain-containing protein [Blastococcus haudaquaticus]|uniref:YetF domain-containing protein n=1 Tax=Blastococcus haudaquaticus TaxID=1938745 RepID=UPI001F17A232|nr:YetF domain-containing protein [Blastococcus haudaquaticus]